MKKVLFGITGLTLGGAERVLVDIANSLADKYDITIFTFYAKGEFEKELKPNIKRVSIFDKTFKELTRYEKIKISFDLLFRKRYLYNKFVKGNYDVEIAFLEGPVTRLFASKNKNVRKIAWVHNDMNRVFGDSFKAKLKIMLEKKSYESYERLIFVSKDNLNSFENIIKIDKPKQIIYNYIDSENVRRNASDNIKIELDPNTVNIVSVSRLVEQKGIDRWIRVHSKLIKEGINQKVYIIGDGPKRAELEKLIKNEGIENSFYLLGKQPNPYPYVKKCDYFALFSYFEGYGMVLEEAKILGKNILITDTAAREAVEGYDNAQIFPNTEEGLLEGLETIKQKPSMEESNKYNNEARIEEIIELIGG